jgi:Spy/CpxP family protein refolding chaperone
VSTSRSTLLLGFLIVVGSAGASQNAWAQRGTNPRAAARKAERQEAKAEAKAEAKGETPAERDARQQRLAGQVREAFARVVKQRLNLTDDQSRRLKEVDDRYETQRNDVARDERQARQALRTQLAAPSGADQAKIDENMAVITKAQQRRAEILASEQKDLGGFLTPKQRSQYFFMRDNLARRIQQMRQNAAPGAPPPEPEQQ